mmetsp:Transcript_17290/g.25755  ORF Transcript_17290/g.25755 Transcript_17290/m.25755 type:complete len:244 (-) Transcript_17290:203-934(-)
MGSRLTKFLAKEIPSHPQYFSMKETLARLREKSQGNLAEISTLMRKLVDEIDQDEYNNTIFEDLMHGFSSHKLEERKRSSPASSPKRQSRSPLRCAFPTFDNDKIDWIAPTLEESDNWASFPSEIPNTLPISEGQIGRDSKADAEEQQRKRRNRTIDSLNCFGQAKNSDAQRVHFHLNELDLQRKKGGNSCQETETTDSKETPYFFLEIDRTQNWDIDTLLTDDKRWVAKKNIFMQCFTSMIK